MKIQKFGGTSVGSPERMAQVANLITRDEEPKIIVLSAVSGTTNALVSIGDSLNAKNKDEAEEKIDNLYEQYQQFYPSLVASESALEEASEVIDKHFKIIKSMIDYPLGVKEEKELLAQGELLSTQLFSIYLKEQGIQSALIPALDFMRIDEDNEPVISAIEERLPELLAEHKDVNLFITQGYICRNPRDEIDNLQRGGSDYTASLIGAAMKAKEIQIWTDIDGMHNNDPRIVEKTYPIADLSFDEAAELAYFGAKILHPSSIRPAQNYNIPVKLLNTMKPDAPGTTISSKKDNVEIKSVAAKDGITAIKIKSTRMLLAYGFLRKIFEIFEKYRTPIDMITTSEVAVSLTIDDRTHLDAIAEEVKQFGEIEIDGDQTIVCIVGNLLARDAGVVGNVTQALQDVPIRMISFGGSKNNISLLIDSESKDKALNRLNEKLFKLQ